MTADKPIPPPKRSRASWSWVVLAILFLLLAAATNAANAVHSTATAARIYHGISAIAAFTLAILMARAVPRTLRSGVPPLAFWSRRGMLGLRAQRVIPVDAAASFLEPGEQFEGAVWAAPGRWFFKAASLAITDRRVFLVDIAPFSFAPVALLWQSARDSITVVRAERWGPGGYEIAFTTPDGDKRLRFSYYWARAARDFVRILNEPTRAPRKSPRTGSDEADEHDS